ncbi:MAG TPA: winged helix-turn-helix domain-containing protein [Candidatus Limnocylindrales bacterium]|nr:winged helix-turn-helix domain-containing protein [Candidatus Limnocylindrales bacterium]
MSVVRTASNLNQIFRFGEFEFSVRSGELRRNGEILRLQYQPQRVLLVMLEYSGDVVTRDEIRERAWPDDSIRDFDNSLRVAVTKLRQAFGDDPDNPRYIETVPRRGYRWLYPVTVHEAQSIVVGPPALAAQVNVDGQSHPLNGESAPLTSVSLKPSRRTVLLRRILLTIALWVVALAATWWLRPQPVRAEPKVLPLTTYPGLEYMPSLSPDGKRVAFAWTGANPTDPYSVYVRPIGDDRAHRLVETPAGAADGDPVWSPDGKSIYFFRRGGGESSGIYAASVGGGPARQLIATSLAGRRLRRVRFDVSPTEHTLVYPDAIPGKETAALFLLDLATLRSRQITNPPPNSEGDGDPAFSHDGKTLAFQRSILDLEQIYILPSSGGDARLLTSNFITDFIDGLAWTSDDREIIFGGSQLRRMSASKGEPSIANISDVPGPATFPAVRGDLLAYVKSAANVNIWKLDLHDLTHAAGEPSKLISSTHQQAAPSFSPDGTRIAFQSDRSGSWEIWVCDRDGSNAVQLSHFGGALTGTPRWSPDGKQIVFDSRANGVSQVYVVSADGGTPRLLTNDAAGGELPSFSHDGKWVYYSSNHNGVTGVWKLPVAGGAPQSVTSGSGIYAAESADGKYLYYCRSAIDFTIWRIPVTGGLEEQVPGLPKPFDTSHWAVVASGIYVVNGNGDLLFFQFGRNTVTTVFHEQRFLTDWSMAISPDGREIAWAQVDDTAADLMLVENFR